MRILSRTVAIASTKAISQLCTIGLGIVMVHLLSKQEVGTFRQVILLYTLVSTFLSINLEASVFYYEPREREQRLAGFLLQTLAIGWLIASAIAFTLFFAADGLAGLLANPNISGLLQTYCLLSFADTTLALVPSTLISQGRVVRASAYALVGTLLRVAALSIVLFSGGSLDGAVKLSVALVSVVALAGVADLAYGARRTRWHISLRQAREQIGYCLPLFFASSLGILSLQMDKLLISRYFDVETFAVYSIGAIDLPVIGLVTTSLSTAILPALIEHARHNRLTDALPLWHTAMRKSALILFPCFAFFLVEAREFMTILYGPAYADAAYPFSIYLLTLPLRIAVYSAFLRALGNTRPIARSALYGFGLNLIASITLLELGEGSWLAFIGPAIGTLLATTLITGISLNAIKRSLARPLGELIPWRELGGLMLIFLISTIPIALIGRGQSPSVAIFMLKATAFAGTALLLLLASGSLRSDERALLRHPLRTLFGSRG